MKCTTFRKNVLPLIMEGKDERELALTLARTNVRLRNHLDLCDECRSYIMSCRVAVERLGEVHVDEPDEREWEGARTAIRRSVRVEAPVYRIAWPQLSSGTWVRVTAFAAVIFFVYIGSMVYFKPHPVEEQPAQSLQIASDVSSREFDQVFLDEIASADQQYDEIISEIDELMREINTACAQIDSYERGAALEGTSFENALI